MLDNNIGNRNMPIHSKFLQVKPVKIYSTCTQVAFFRPHINHLGSESIHYHDYP